ncbi:hypothetical protein GF354_02965 [Candidatus Peregrinibacteria bacterium]|nr:hypothetical protein [Candidatus Peregrinibacteria bacterium]
MKISFKNAVGTPIVLPEHRRPLTTVKDVVIDTERGKIVAFVTDKARNFVLSPIDIRSWTNFITINDKDAVIEGKDILRVAEIQKQGLGLMHKKVFTKNDEFLGKVYDFEFSTKTFEILSILCIKTFLGLISTQSRIIPKNQIIEITKEKIIVKENLKTVKEKASETSLAVS